MASIQTNYNLYLRDNVTQYLELKNKVAEFITDIVSRTGEYATEMLDKFKTNLLAILGFLFSVILANIVSDQPLDNIFTKDITILSEIVLIASLEEFFHKYINIRSCQLLRINPETKKWNCSMATRANRRETRYLPICCLICSG